VSLAYEVQRKADALEMEVAHPHDHC